MRLIIGNKNYSSWSMRPWVLMRELDIPFEEELISFNDVEFKAKVLRYSKAGKVPILIDGDATVWDSLAIVGYLAEKFSDRGIWPKDRLARAQARSIVAEMHAGFREIRQVLPMNCEARFSHVLLTNAVRKEAERIFDMWSTCRRTFGAAGPFLFGTYSAADAYFAPVAVRFSGYGIETPEAVTGYMETLLGTASVRRWLAEAIAEKDFAPEDEIYRTQR